MAGPCWAAAIANHLHIATTTATAASSSGDIGGIYVAAPPVVQTNKPESMGAGRQACLQILSSTMPRALQTTDSKVTLSDTTSRMSPAQNITADKQSFYGQILTKTLLQASKQQQQCLDKKHGPSYLAQAEVGAQNTSVPVRILPASSSVSVQNENTVALVRVVSTDREPVLKTERQLVFPAQPQQSPSVPLSPHNGNVSVQAAFPESDSSFGSPASSSCLSPDHFLGSSPHSHSVASPASECPTQYPDTTDPTVPEADSGYSDTLTDKSTSPDMQPSTDSAQTTPTKRKRVRKSRAKQQNPEQKIIVKKTRRMRANDRERSRMHGLNDAMDELRKHLPNDGNAGKLTKIDTLRTASNYIKVLKMMLGEMENGEDLTHWSTDMVTAVNNLYVQPAASPDSTGVTSPAPLNVPFEDGQQLQNCGMVSSGVAGGVMMSTPFPDFQTQSCGLADNFGSVGNVSGVVPHVNPLMSSGLLGPNNAVSVLGNSTSYNSLPAANTAVQAGYNSMNSFVPSAVNSGYTSHPYVISGHCSSTQNMFQQSSQCY